MGMSPLEQNMKSAGLAGIDRLAGNAMFPQSQMDKTQYATPTQMPTSAEIIRSDYEPKTDPYSGMPMTPFKKGGLAAIKFEEGGDVDVSGEETKPPTMAELASQINEAYRTNANYDQLWKQFAATKEQDPREWYRHQLGFLGGQVGWQQGQNTSERASALEPQIQSTVAQAKAAGLGDAEINNILKSSSQAANIENQRRIATLAETGGSGFNFGKDLAPGLIMVGGAALGAYGLDAALAAAAAEGTLGAGAAAMGPTYAELGYTPALVEGAGAAGAGEAASQGLTLKDAYNAYRYANMGKNVLNALSGGAEGARSAGYSPTGLPYASSYQPFNPNVNTGAGVTGLTGVGLSQYTNPLAGLEPRVQLSKLSEFSPNFAEGGITSLGGYSDGGRLLKGPGDGMSDNIPASIGHKQPARLADGEFVVPADVVSHLGNGSTDAGAKQLYKMMDKVRQARTGSKKQGKQINPNKFLPKG